MYDVIVVGGGFAGVTAAREAALRGADVLLLEARERLGGRTWSDTWNGLAIERGGAWVHWHQPHTFSELTRAGLPVEVSADAERAGWYLGDERREGTMAERDAIARRGWDVFCADAQTVLPQPHDPLGAIDALARYDRMTIAERIAELDLDDEARSVLTAEVESVAHAPLEDAGAVSVLRWHALSGYSLALTQFTGGRVTMPEGTGALLRAIAEAAPVRRELGRPVAEIRRTDDRVEVHMRDGAIATARAVVVALPLNALGAVAFTPALPEDKQAAIALGQASRGVKIFIHARGPRTTQNAVRPGHPFGYIDSEAVLEAGSQLFIGFGVDQLACDVSDLAAVQRALDAIIPGYEVIAATAHDWFADEFARGTWAIHRPGWYEHHHSAMRRREGRVVFAGSDIANGWAGFIDGAIETGLVAGRAAVEVSRERVAAVVRATAA